MKIDEITKQSLLYDFYGALLSERQREVMELYHEENLSLAEIADEFGISRQGVHDALHKAEKSLENYEEKLGLVEKFNKTSDAISNIERRIDRLIAKAVEEIHDDSCDGDMIATDNKDLMTAGGGFAEELANIRKIIDALET